MNTASQETLLMALETAAMERWRNGDPMGWAEISAPEVTYVDPGLTKPIAGLQEYERYLEGLKGKIFYQGSEFLRPKVALYGDLAVMTYNYRSAGQTLWNTTEVYALLAGDWKIVHSHWSFVGHSAPNSLELPLPVELAPVAYTGVLGELMTLESAAMERSRQGDLSGFIAIRAPEVTYFGTDTPQRLDGLDALKDEYAKRAGKSHYDVMEFLAPAAQVHGDAAVLFYRFLETRLRPDGSIECRAPWNCTEIFAKTDGVWKTVHTHWSFINGRQRPASPTTRT